MVAPVEQPRIGTMTNMLGTEELELVSGGWFAGFQLHAAAAKSVLSSVKNASPEHSELPSGWENGMTTVPHLPD